MTQPTFSLRSNYGSGRHSRHPFAHVARSPLRLRLGASYCGLTALPFDRPPDALRVPIHAAQLHAASPQSRYATTARSWALPCPCECEASLATKANAPPNAEPKMTSRHGLSSASGLISHSTVPERNDIQCHRLCSALLFHKPCRS